MNNEHGRVSARKTQTAASTLPEIGKIKIGEKRKSSSGVEYPTSLDYFRATGSFTGEFQNTFGDKPKRLDIVFISDNLSEVCNERYECWNKGKRWGWGDGSTFTVWDPVAKKYVEGVDPTDKRVTSIKWDLMLTLRFVLLQMRGVMGYWSFSTKAKATTIPSIVQAFDFVRGRAGTIIGFPFNLTVEKVTSYSPEEAKNYPVVKLVPNFSQESIEMVEKYLEAGGSVQRLSTTMIQQKNLLEQLPKTIHAPEANIQTNLLTNETNGGQNGESAKNNDQQP